MEGRQYETLDDEAVVLAAQSGDSEATETLLNRYKGLVSVKSRPYFLVGADREDITQEGMIGLYKAIKEYDGGHGLSFRQYAELRIQNQVLAAVKSASRQKHIPLNYYVSLSQPVYEEGNAITLMDTLAEQKNSDPMELIIGQENLNSIEKHLLPMLSPLERSVFYAYLEGKSYQDVARELGRTPKSIDNTIQRVKFKLEEVLRADGITIEGTESDARRAQHRERRRESVRLNAREHARAQARGKTRAAGRVARRPADSAGHRTPPARLESPAGEPRADGD